MYSLAVVLFEMLAGRPPFQAKAPGELIAMHILEPAPRIDGFVKGVPQVLVDLFVCMLNKTPEARPSMREVQNVLSSLIEGLPTVASLADGLPTVALSASSFPEVPAVPVSKAPASKPSTRIQSEPRRGLAMAALLSAGVLVAGLGAFAAWRFGPTRGFRSPPAKSSPALRPAVPAPPPRASAPPAAADPAPAPAAAPSPAPREPAQPAPVVRRSAAERPRNKPTRSRPSESAGSRPPSETPVF